MPQSVNLDDCDDEHLDNKTDENSVTDVVVNAKNDSVLEKVLLKILKTLVADLCETGNCHQIMLIMWWPEIWYKLSLNEKLNVYNNLRMITMCWYQMLVEVFCLLNNVWFNFK